MNSARLQPGSTWTARLIVAITCLVALCLVGVFLALIWGLFGSNYDFPPTWYLALTMLLSIADVAAMCYIAFKTCRVLLGNSMPLRLLQVMAAILVVLAASHTMAAYAFDRIPQWDFQDDLFSDLSQPLPGKVSSDCQEAIALSASPRTSVSPSLAPDAERPTTYEEAQRLARITDWRTHEKELRNRTIGGWHGWIQDVSHHGYYDNPDHRIVSLFLHDPYSQLSAPPNAVSGHPNQHPNLVLHYFSSMDVTKLTVGQEVLVCGRIRDVTKDDGTTRVDIYEPVVNPLPLPETLTSTHVPDDFSLEYEAHGCGDGYNCAEYKLTIDAKSNITYEGFQNVPITGTHTTRMSSEKLNQLVFELQRTRFLSIDNLPEKLEGDPAGATIIRASMDGRSKAIVLPWRSGVWPANVIMIIGKIEEVSNLHKWVTLVK